MSLPLAFEDRRSLSPEASSTPKPERDAGPDREVGAWPEGLDLAFYADSSVTLPGTGSSGTNCGLWFPREFCDECGEPSFGRSRCEQRGCPSCWRAWARRRAENITSRLGAFRYNESEGLEKRLVHCVTSPPSGEVRSLTDVSKGFREAYRLAESKGVRGGVTIFHGFRVTDEAKNLYEQDKANGEWDPEEQGRLWSWVRSRPEGWRSLTYWSPHWHVLGVSVEFQSDDPSNQDGWVARRIRSLAPFKLHDKDGYEDMIGASIYLLSHAAFESDSSKDCVRWFGELATTKFSPESALSDGSLSVIERYAAEAAEAGPSRSKDNGEVKSDPCMRCGSTSFSPIWEAGQALMDTAWCRKIGREQEHRLSTAFEWVIGQAKPPPGMKHPTTEAEAREVFEHLL